MAKDLFAFDAPARRDADAEALGGMLKLPDAGAITGQTGYEAMTETPELAAPEVAQEPEADMSATAGQPLRLAPTVGQPAVDTAQISPVYDPTQTGEITAGPSYAPSEDVGQSVTLPAGATAAPTAAPVGAPAIAGSFPEEQARVYQQARASGLDDEGARVLVAVSETEGGARGAVGDQGKSRGIYQFHEQGEMPAFRAWLRQQNIPGDPNQLAVDPEIATRYAAEGYLGQAIRRGRELGYSGAELATYVQRTGQRSVDPGKTGANYTRLFGPGAASGPVAAPSVTQTASEARAQSGETRLAGITPPQFGLGDADAEAICGPVLAMAFAKSTGRNPTIAEAKQMAKDYGGWTGAQGMGGPEAMAATLRAMGIPATYKPGPLDVELIRRETAGGNPVGINTAGHYFVVEGVDQDGRLDLGNSAKALRASGGRQWFRPEEIAGLGMGAPTGVIVKDNPASPTPSVAVRETRMPPAEIAAPADPAARREADALALKAIVEPSPSSTVAAPAGPDGAALPPSGPTMLKTSDIGAPAWPGEGRNPDMEYPFDVREPGTQPYQQTDAEGIDRTNDSLYPPPGPARSDPAYPGYRHPFDVPPGAMYRQPLAAQPELPPDQPIDPDQGPREATPGSVGASPPVYDPRIADEATTARELPVQQVAVPQAPVGGQDDPGTQVVAPVPQGRSVGRSWDDPPVTPPTMRERVEQGAEPPPLQQPVVDVVKRAFETLTRAQEWLTSNPVTGSLTLPGMGRQLAGADQLADEVRSLRNQYEALVARYQAGDRSVEPEMLAVEAELNARLGVGQGWNQRLLEAGARNPNKGAETVGTFGQAAIATALAPSLGSGVVRNVAAAAVDPLGQATGAALELPGRALEAAAPVARRVGEFAMDVGREGAERAVFGNVPRMIQETGGGLADDLGRAAGQVARSVAPDLADDAGRAIRLTPARVAAEADAGPVRGASLNRRLPQEGSAIPLRVRAATALTDDQASLRWAEDVLTQDAGRGRLPENAPERASTIRRVNPDSVAEQRIRDELAPTVAQAQKGGLLDELTQYLQDTHERDVLDEFYRRGRDEAITAGKTAAEAEAEGLARMRRRASANADLSYEAVTARLAGQQQRLGARASELDELAGSVWSHNRATLDRMLASGRITPEQHVWLTETYPHYVPTVPISHLDPGGGRAAVGRGSGVSATRSGPGDVKAFEDVASGSERLNPIIASRDATIARERVAHRNEVFQAFSRLYDDAQQLGSEAARASGGARRQRFAGEVEVSGRVAGEPVTLRVPKPVAEVIDTLGQMGAGGGAVGLWKAAMSAVTTSITGRRLAFAPVNLARDLGDSLLRAGSEYGPGVLPEYLGLWMRQAGNAAVDLAAGAVKGDLPVTGAAKEYLRRGGGMGPAHGGWKAGEEWYAAARRAGGLAVTEPGDVARILKDLATFKPVMALNERAELVSRTAMMQLAERHGAGATEAMIAGRNASIDFQRAGTVVRMFNGAIPFLNATVQSGAQLTRTFRDHPTSATATFATVVGLPVIAAEAYNRSDPERARAYDDVPQYLKDQGIVVMLPWAGSDARGERPNYAWLPLGMGAPVAVAIREAMRDAPFLEPAAPRSDLASDAGEVERWAGVAAQVFSVFSPIKGDSASSVASSLVPPGAKQAVELGANKNLYTGGQIASDAADERASAAARGAAGLANEAGRALGSDVLQEVRPSQVDYLGRQLPAYGDVITGVSDLVAPSAAKQAEDRPVQNAPVAGALAGRLVRDTGGEALERARNDMLSPTVRDGLATAGLRPSDVTPVRASIQDVPLTRDEQAAFQTLFNEYLTDEMGRAMGRATWGEDAAQQAIGRARQKAAQEILRSIPAGDRRDRQEAAGGR